MPSSLYPFVLRGPVFPGARSEPWTQNANARDLFFSPLRARFLVCSASAHLVLWARETRRPRPSSRHPCSRQLCAGVASPAALLPATAIGSPAPAACLLVIVASIPSFTNAIYSSRRRSRAYDPRPPTGHKGNPNSRDRPNCGSTTGSVFGLNPSRPKIPLPHRFDLGSSRPQPSTEPRSKATSPKSTSDQATPAHIHIKKKTQSRLFALPSWSDVCSAPYELLRCPTEFPRSTTLVRLLSLPDSHSHHLNTLPKL